jgi:hypothetical protein
MARPRKNDMGLPPNLYVQVRNDSPCYTYRSPITGRSISFSGDRERAIRYAQEANLQVQSLRAAKSHARESIKHGHVDARGLLEHETISRKALLYDHVCGVYFLLLGENIVYVGQSTNVLTRISSHQLEGAKIFDRIFVVECRQAELCHLEALYIDKFKPRYNAQIPPVSDSSTAWDASLSDLLCGAAG